MSELARRAGLTPRAVSVEVARLDAAGLVTVEAIGPAHVVRPRTEHPAFGPLRALLGAASPSDADRDDEAVRQSLAAHGAPLLGEMASRPLPLGEALVRGIALARTDAQVLLVLPALLARRAGEIDWAALEEAARRQKLKAELGFLIDLTAEVVGLPALRSRAAGLGDARRRLQRYLPATSRPYERRLAGLRSPPCAARWNFQVNIPEGAFRAACEQGPPATPGQLSEAFVALDRGLAEAVTVTLVGGAALALLHPGRQAPASIELASVEGLGFDRARELLRPHLPPGLEPRLAPEPVAPAEWRYRRLSAGPPGLGSLRVLVPERHDAALMCVASGLAHDLQAAEALHRAAPLRLGVLLSRYFEVDPDQVPDPEALRLSFLALVERLFGRETATRTDSGLRGAARS